MFRDAGWMEKASGWKAIRWRKAGSDAVQVEVKNRRRASASYPQLLFIKRRGAHSAHWRLLKKKKFSNWCWWRETYRKQEDHHSSATFHCACYEEEWGAEGGEGKKVTTLNTWGQSGGKRFFICLCVNVLAFGTAERSHIKIFSLRPFHSRPLTRGFE